MTNEISIGHIDEILAENMRRKRLLHTPYNPATGRNASLP